MRRWLRMAAAMACAVVLAACASGPAKRVSEPTASIQELQVRADGSWSVSLRLQNFSNVPMRFERVALTIKAGGETVGALQGEPALSVGPESADTAMLSLNPSSSAKIAVATALAEGRSLQYELEGIIDAAAKDGRPRPYQIKRKSALSPVPGLPGVMR
jgi:hypothetical protein